MNFTKNQVWRRSWMGGVGAAAVLSLLAPQTAWAAGSTNTTNSTTSTSNQTSNAIAQPLVHSGARLGGLVALGDSITFGYNLNPANLIPSQQAFPYLVGTADNMPVTDLGVPSWTSADLVSALQTPNFQRAIANARVVSIDIGNNDLLHLAAQLGLLSAAQSGQPITITPTDQAKFVSAIQTMAMNLKTIIASVKAQTDAPIVLYNLYDPFPTGSALHTAGEQFIPSANQAIAAVAAAVGIPVADAYSAFDGKQTTLVRVAEGGDVHPTPAGQQVLAQLLEKVVSSLTLPQGPASGSTAAVTTALATNPLATTGSTWTSTLGSGAQVTVTAPSGAVAFADNVAVTSTSLSALQPLAPTNDKVVAEFGLDFQSGDTPTQAVTVKYINQAIPAGAKLYEVSASKGLIAVPGTPVSTGQVNASVIGDVDFVVVAPIASTPPTKPKTPKTAVPGATSVSTGFPWLTDGLAGLLLIAFGLLVLRGARRRR